MALRAREGKDGAGGGAPDAGQGLQSLDVLRDPAVVLFDNEAGGAMEVAGAGVVTQAGPEVQHLVDRRDGQGIDGRETRHKAFVVGDDGGDLGLLKHDFGDPDAVRRGILLPGELLAAVGFEPGQEPRGEGGGVGCHRGARVGRAGRITRLCQGGSRTAPTGFRGVVGRMGIRRAGHALSPSAWPSAQWGEGTVFEAASERAGNLTPGPSPCEERGENRVAHGARAWGQMKLGARS